MRSFSFHDGIVGGAPRDVGIVHHQVDEERHQKSQDPRAVANLVAVRPRLRMPPSGLLRFRFGQY